MKLGHVFLSLCRRRRLEADLAEEMRLHLEARIQENITAGMTPEEARYAALRRFGGMDQVKEQCRDQHRDAWGERFLFTPFRLLRHGFGSVRRTPILALTIVGTLGIALAACVLVFSFLNNFLLRPLPFGNAAQLVVVYEHSLKGGRGNAIALTYDNLVAIEERAGTFSRLGILQSDSALVHNEDGAEAASLLRVSADLFPLVGARAALGSVITPANAENGGERAVVLSDALWRRRFKADAGVIGRTIRIGDQPFHVVGVMPAGFALPMGGQTPEAWPALLPRDYRPTANTAHRFHVRHLLCAELAPGVSVAAANARLNALAATLREEFPKENADRGFFAVSLRENLLGDFGRRLVLLQGAVLLVLVVACFNCLCLLIARGLQRRREFAVRLALGASRGNLLAQLFAESLWLALPAAGLAMILAAVGLPAGISLLPTLTQPGLNALPRPELDGTVAAAVVGTAIVIALAFSALPLFQTRKLNLEAALRDGGRSAGSVRAGRTTRVLAAGQIAVALALLISAALLVRSQRALQRLDIGLPTAQLDLFHVGLRGDHYMRSPDARLQFFERFREQLLTLPGVHAVGVASFFLVEPPSGYQSFVQEGDGGDLAQTEKRALTCSVVPATFSALGIPLLEGRLLTETDIAGHPPVAVVNATLAAKYWPGESALGKRVRLQSLHAGPYAEAWTEIVGVVADVHGTGNQPQVIDMFYMTIAQAQPPGLGMGFYIRHGGVPPDERAYRRALAQVDPTLQLFAHETPVELQERASWQSRFVTRLIGVFALLAVALTLAGIYAVNSFLVGRRTVEFGIRAALGATQSTLLRLVLGDSLRLLAAGLVVGTALAFAGAHSFASLLFGVTPLEPLVYVAAALLMTAACVAATLLPARRAAKIDPVVALRAE
jgi:predicted permease